MLCLLIMSCFPIFLLAISTNLHIQACNFRKNIFLHLKMFFMYLWLQLKNWVKVKIPIIFLLCTCCYGSPLSFPPVSPSIFQCLPPPLQFLIRANFLFHYWWVHCWSSTSFKFQKRDIFSFYSTSILLKYLYLLSLISIALSYSH